jgi:hypothetical protein
MRGTHGPDQRESLHPRFNGSVAGIQATVVVRKNSARMVLGVFYPETRAPRSGSTRDPIAGPNQDVVEAHVVRAQVSPVRPPTSAARR